MNPITYHLPKEFCLLNNHEEVLSFFLRVRKALEKKSQVTIDFSTVSTITPSAVALLLAKVSNRRWNNGGKIKLIRPVNSDVDTVLQSCGFYALLGKGQTSQKGVIHTKKNNNVDVDIALQVRVLTARHIYGQDDSSIKPLYRTLIECMANTKNHASNIESIQTTWWLVVYNGEKETGEKWTSFSFIDTGVGIYNSANIKKLLKFAAQLKLTRRTDILKDMLEGNVGSRTGLDYRGKGLPKIYNDFMNGHLKNLHIVTNKVFLGLETGTSVEMNKSLDGTFLYWEIHNN